MERVNGLPFPVAKIDDFATNGLTGVVDSLAYRMHTTERHHHHFERWFGAAAVPNGTIHVADSVLTNPSAFQIDAGNDDWGAWVQVLGSADTPAIADKVEYDLHQIDFVAVERANTTYLFQIGYGASGAAALTAGTYTERVFRPQSVQGRPAPIPLETRRQDVGTLAWMRCLAQGADTGTLDFFIGDHEYEG